MKVLIFGATGMVGEGVLRYVLAQSEVTAVTIVVRRPMDIADAKLTQIVETDLFELKNPEELNGFDACLFCLGVSSVGMSEAEYRRITQQLTLQIARELLPRNPNMVFEYITGEGTNKHGKQMWARVKGETEDALLAMGFRDAYMLRPGFIEPMRGARPRVWWIKWLYYLMRPAFPLLRRLPRGATSTDNIGKAMLRLAREGSVRKVLDSAAINRVAGLN